MDILDSAQQKINDAASQVNPPASSAGGPPPEPPPAPAFTASEPSSPPAPTMPAPASTPVELPKAEEPPKELKEEAILPEKSETPVPPPPVTEPDLKPAEPPQSTTFGAPTPKETKPEPPPSPPPAKKGGVGKGVILGGLLLLLVTLPVAVFYISQQQQQLTETRSKAAGESCAWCAGLDQCPNPQARSVAVCGGLNCCTGYVAGGGAPAPTSGGGGGGTTPLPDNITSGCCSNDQQCIGWFGSVSRCINPNGACQSGKQCRGSTCTPTHVCTNLDCGISNGCGQICNGGCSAGGPTPTGLTGTICNDTCCQADTSRGFWVQKCTCSGQLPPSGICMDNCVSAGASACIPDNFCGSMQLDIKTAAGQELSINGKTQIAKNGNGVCATTTPSGCKSDWCTSSADCLSKGGTVGTPASFPSCSPGLVACCGVPNQPTVTPTQPPAVGQCTRIKVYKDNVAVDPKTLKVGDNVVLAVAGTNATKGRIRVNGAAFTETTTKNASGEYTVPFTIPSGVPSFTIEAEVFADNQWK